MTRQPDAQKRSRRPTGDDARERSLASTPDKAAVAAALASDTTRWGFSHLAVGVGSGFTLLAFLAIRSYLREAGEERWSILALPFIV